MFIYILGGAIFGGILCYSFITEYLQMKKSTNQILENAKDYVKNDHSMVQRILSLLGMLVAIIAAVCSSGVIPSSTDYLTVALGVALFLMFVGQYLSITYHSCYWENGSSIITCGKLIRFKSVKEIKVKNSLFMKSYSVITFNGDDVLVSKKTALFLEEKTGKKINSNRSK